MTIEPLGDQAILARFDDEASAARWANALRGTAPPWLIDVVPAYFTVAVFFDPQRIRFRDAEAWLRELTFDPNASAQAVGRRFLIPCCYELGPDLAWVAEMKNLSIEEVIALHTSVEYTVYAIGFCPGFPYLGYLPDRLAGVPRLGTPRVRVEPGSVGLTGRQTGIYPLVRPGGWPLIGRIPLEIVNLEAGYFALETGDLVRFTAISSEGYRERLSRRLVPENERIEGTLHSRQSEKIVNNSIARRNAAR